MKQNNLITDLSELFKKTIGSYIVEDAHECKNAVITVEDKQLSDILEMLEIENDFVKHFIDGIQQKNVNNKLTLALPAFAIYDMSHYSTLHQDILTVVQQFKAGLKNHRQLIVTFNKLHCFQSVQFLINYDKSVTVSCCMRSCNFIKNLKYDIAIVFILAEVFRNLMQSVNANHLLKNNRYISATILIGSLHIFSKDAEQAEYNFKNGGIFNVFRNS